MNGKVVLITGTSSGFGAETSAHLASLGCSLALVDRAPQEDTLQRCLQAGLTKDQVLILIADLSDLEQTKAVVDETVEHFGKLDILINNAGIAAPESVADTSEEKYDQVMGINSKAVFFLCQLAIPHLIKTKGNIVNVSSVYGFLPSATATAYAVSKAAVNQITRCAALELAPKQIRVNAVNPGHIRTGLYKGMGIPDDTVTCHLENLVKRYPIGRLGSTLEIAKAITFLADDTQSSFITGACLPVDGGFSLGAS